MMGQNRWDKIMGLTFNSREMMFAFIKIIYGLLCEKLAPLSADLVQLGIKWGKLSNTETFKQLNASLMEPLLTDDGSYDFTPLFIKDNRMIDLRLGQWSDYINNLLKGGLAALGISAAAALYLIFGGSPPDEIQQHAEKLTGSETDAQQAMGGMDAESATRHGAGDYD